MPASGSRLDDAPVVVVVGDTQWRGHRLAAQHIAERLSRYATVVYVDPPLSRLGLRRQRARFDLGPWRGLERLDDGLYRLGCLVGSGKTRPVTRRLAHRAFRRQIVRAVAGISGSVHAVIQIPVHFPVLGAFGEAHRVHLASDDFVAAARQNQVDEGWVRAAERTVAEEATTVLAVSEPLAERWRSFGFDPVLVPNGCDVDLYATTDDVAPADDVTLPAPIAGFIGTISDRTDVSLLQAVADRGHSILLVGPRSFTAPNDALDDLVQRSNVQWVGARPYTDVPRYLAHMRVGLVPYRASAFNEASFPLKTLDYLAGGRAVVSTDLPAMQVIGTDLVDVGADGAAFVAAVERALATPPDPERAAARRARAAQHSWDARVADIAASIGLDRRDA